MKKRSTGILAVMIFTILFSIVFNITAYGQKKDDKDARMKWWREARFGLFIHWGLYAIPAGEWNGKYDYGEWIRTSAQIPLEQYDKFLSQFNPVKFNAGEWVKIAKDAGMKYIVITSKHHDGFCLFDSKYTDFDVMSTPFKRDIMKELSDAAHKEGIKICWYHSIMDWHQPDYLPRREWEKDRSTAGADFKKYVEHLKNQLTELVTKYGDIGILWFDGEWEATWNHKYGKEIYDYLRKLQPAIIINNRIDVARAGMEGMTTDDSAAGDYGTPEQTIPATGLPGVDWETCMTMNEHWGYNKTDKNFKSVEDLLRKLADIASKGGNFLLNVGPTAEGVFPEESIAALKAMGEWMKINGESIYATKASPFKSLEWGRCTQKNIKGGARLYLHVFDWPKDGRLVVPGIYNALSQAYLLSNNAKLSCERKEDAVIISLPAEAPDKINSVVVLDVKGKTDISNPPVIDTAYNQFIKTMKIKITSDRPNIEIRYTTDGNEPDAKSPVVNKQILLNKTCTVKARCFRNGKPVSASASAYFRRTDAEQAMKTEKASNGLRYAYYEGDWDKIPELGKLTPVKTGVIEKIDLSVKKQPEYFAVEFNGYIEISKEDVYKFYINSDDGSNLFINDKLLIDNDGLHGSLEKSGIIALAKGYHKIKIQYLQKTGGHEVSVSFESPGAKKRPVPSSSLFN